MQETSLCTSPCSALLILSREVVRSMAQRVRVAASEFFSGFLILPLSGCRWRKIGSLSILILSRTGDQVKDSPSLSREARLPLVPLKLVKSILGRSGRALESIIEECRRCHVKHIQHRAWRGLGLHCLLWWRHCTSTNAQAFQISFPLDQSDHRCILDWKSGAIHHSSMCPDVFTVQVKADYQASFCHKSFRWDHFVSKAFEGCTSDSSQWNSWSNRATWCGLT